MLSRRAAAALIIAMAGLPLAGAALAGRALEPLFRFPPPLAIPDNYPTWSWFACAAVLAPFIAIAVSWWRGRRTTGQIPIEPNVTPSPSAAHATPAYAWGALAWTLGWWALAWTRFTWFAPLQRYTFFPLWLGFVVTVRAFTTRPPVTASQPPRPWLLLFAISAGFWWMFEWLNRFVHNWHYLGVEDFGPLAYACHATLCFSTVLPAVTAVHDWLRTHPSWLQSLRAGPRWPWFERRGTGVLLVAGGAAGLFLTGPRPYETYPALWTAPLALALGGGICSGEKGIWSEVAAGDWRRVGTWALAALICGFFWELWNVHSAAKWIYTVPYVNRGHLFEMPLLGYLGYLPFGVECLVVVAVLDPGRDMASHGR